MARKQRPVKGKQGKKKKKSVQPAAPRKAAKAKAKALVKVEVPAKPKALAKVKAPARLRAPATPEPAAEAGEEQAPELARPERRRGPRSIEGVLARLAAAQTLEAAYHAWDELRVERAAALERFAEDGRRLGKQAGFWIAAARAAAGSGAGPGDPAAPDELAPAEPLQRAVAEAEAKLKAAAAAVEAQARKTDAEFAEADLHVRAVIKARVQRYAASARPKVVLVRHPAGQSRTILHLERVRSDESVVLMFLLAGKLPTRYGFLFDDSTDNVSRPPPWLYTDEGVTAEHTRPPPRSLQERLLAPQDYVPVKGFVPLFIHPAQGEPLLYRLLQRGAVMEVEIADGDDFRNLLAMEEAERVAGALMRLKLDGRIDLELDAS